MTRIEIIKNTDKELVLAIADEDHTIGNLISRLAEDKQGVVYSAYRIEHPLIPKLTITIVTDGSRKPLEVLKEVLKDIMDMSKEFEEKLSKQIKQ